MSLWPLEYACTRRCDSETRDLALLLANALAYGLRRGYSGGRMRVPVKQGGAAARSQPLATPDSRVATIRKGIQ